jgi:cobalamin biosynthesis Mg chelatase CobN
VLCAQSGEEVINSQADLSKDRGFVAAAVQDAHEEMDAYREHAEHQVRRGASRPFGQSGYRADQAATRALEGRLLGRYSETGTGRWVQEYSPWSAPGMHASAAKRLARPRASSG